MCALVFHGSAKCLTVQPPASRRRMVALNLRFREQPARYSLGDIGVEHRPLGGEALVEPPLLYADLLSHRRALTSDL
jgi:hypothetical protein